MWMCLGIVTYILSLLVCVASYGLDYVSTSVKVDSFSQLLYTMQVSMGGAENTIFQILGGFFQEYWLRVLLLTLLLAAYIYWMRRISKSRKEENHIRKGKLHGIRTALVLRALVLCACLCTCSLLGDTLREGYSVLKIGQYLDEKSHISSLYESYYVDPGTVAISAPETKKNLIYIYCESMESSYTSLEQGGALESNLIPQLTELARENTNFSSGDTVNGARVTTYTSWTIAGMVAQTSGTPLCIENSEFTKNFDEGASFLPNLTTLGDILEEDGYTNYLMVGSEAAYAGRANYFSQHGNYEIFDLQTARDTGKIPENYKEWWGFEDSKLFEYAKEQISQLASQSEPFNFTMLTADTHFKDGYLCVDCPDVYDEQMENVITCSDTRIAEFVSWIQEQDFYEDTVIVISGDHLSMDGYFPSVIDLDYDRKTYFTVINGPEYTTDQARDFTTLDIFPTTLEALSYQVEGHRLGLGTSLYSSVPTLCESLGFEQLNQEIAYTSMYYENQILKDDEIE